METFSVKNLSFKFNNAACRALSDINLSVSSGEFLLVIGESGSGKTTLLRMFKNELRPKGELSGEILFLQKNIDELSDNDSAAKIGYIAQNPDAQIVSDRVYGELAFGLESLGLDNKIIRARVSEFASYFGLSGDFRKKTASLSGGQKQLLNLAAVMAMEPEVIILDEPTSQLDPISASEFLDALRRVNEDFGKTVIIAEHHLSEVFKLADKVLCLENGGVKACGKPSELAAFLKGERIEQTLPVSARIFNHLGLDGGCPLSVKEGRAMLGEYKNDYQISYKEIKTDKKIIDCRDLWFRYDKNGSDILKGCDLSVYQGEFYALLGENGCGKSTLLNLINGSVKQYRGKIRRFSDRLACLPQNPRNLFVKDKLGDDLESVDNSYKELSDKFNLSHLLARHPYDLSGGELQRAALCKLMLTKPEVLLLDEATKGLDSFSKNELGAFLRGLTNEGLTVLCVTHDLDFAAEFADRCGLLFDGGITVENYSNPFFSSNAFYTTQSAKISRGIFTNAVTYDDIIKCLDAGDRV